MCDKVQLRKEACETSLFHHGLVKLMVLHELHKIGRDWDTFIFMSSFQNKTGLSPLAAKEHSTATSPQAEAKAKRISKLKARKQIGESTKPLTIQDTPQQSIKETVYESSAREGVQRRRTRS